VSVGGPRLIHRRGHAANPGVLLPISLNGELIGAVDVGNGVYLTIPWLLPGVVVPTSR
jgi:hypothetical protein